MAVEISEVLHKKLKAITRARRFMVRKIDETELSALRFIGYDGWCVYAGRQVAWSQRDNGQWVIFVL
jgi:hypothetical protein